MIIKKKNRTNKQTEQSLLFLPKFDPLFLYFALPIIAIIPQLGQSQSFQIVMILAVVAMVIHLVIKLWLTPIKKYSSLTQFPIIAITSIIIVIALVGFVIFQYSQNQVISIYGFGNFVLSYTDLLLLLLYLFLLIINIHLKNFDLGSYENRHLLLKEAFTYLYFFGIISLSIQVLLHLIFPDLISPNIYTKGFESIYMIYIQSIILGVIGVLGRVFTQYKIFNFSYLIFIVTGILTSAFGRYEVMILFFIGLIYTYFKINKYDHNRLTLHNYLFIPMFILGFVLGYLNLIQLDANIFNQSRLNFTESYNLATTSKFTYTTIFWGYGHATSEEIINTSTNPSVFTDRNPTLIVKYIDSSLFQDVLERGIIWMVIIILIVAFTIFSIPKFQKDDYLMWVNLNYLALVIYILFPVVQYAYILFAFTNAIFLITKPSTSTRSSLVTSIVSVTGLAPIYPIIFIVIFGLLLYPGDMVTVVSQKFSSSIEFANYTSLLKIGDLRLAYDSINKSISYNVNDPYLRAEKALLNRKIADIISRNVSPQEVEVQQLNTEAALQLKKTTEEIYPNSVYFWSLRSDFYSGLKNQYLGADEQALFAKKQLVVINPYNPVFLLKLAEEYVKLGDFDQSISLLESALSIKPDYPEVIILLASQYYLINQDAKAFNIIAKISNATNLTVEQRDAAENILQLITSRM
jgi:tetratricopeptide (TPR) repeat protein